MTTEIRDNLFAKDIEAIGQIPVISKLLDVICQTTGMGFAAVARVTEDRWITCTSRDDLGFGLKPGDELQIKTTICDEIRQSGTAVIIDHVDTDPLFAQHQTPKMYGFQSYISVPIILKDGFFFGTLCAIDPKPNQLDNTAIRGMFDLFAELISFHLNANNERHASELQLTEERLLHRKVEESNDQLAFAIEAAELGTFDYDPITGRFSANERLRSWFGFNKTANVKIEDAFDAIDVRDRERVKAAVLKTLDFSSAGKYDCIYTIIHPLNGRETIVHAKGRAWFNEDNIAYRFNGTVEDITEQTVSRRKIEHDQQKLNVVIEASELGVWELNMRTMKVTYSERYIEIFGHPKNAILSHEQMVGQLHPADKLIREKAHKLAYEKGKLEYQARFFWPDGSLHWLHIKGQMFYDIERNPINMMGTVRDVTEHKTFAEKLELTVHERTNQLKENNEKLERMNKELQSFAYISSHDLQEPLRKIQTFTSWIEEKEQSNLTDEGKLYFKRIENAAGRMQALINDLLSYSRTEIAEKNFKKTDLKSLVDEARSDLFEELEKKGALVMVGKMPSIRVIPFQFRQLVYNLISNSLKFSHPGRTPEIRIESDVIQGEISNVSGLSPETKYCHIRISDNGIGFEQQYAKKIFELFQRLHGKLDYTGTGIGLAIVKKIVDNHGGAIKATAAPGEGASFDIYIPFK